MKAHRWLSLLGGLLIALLAFWLREWETQPPPGWPAPPARPNAARTAPLRWQVIDDGQLVTGRTNDGDSFQIMHAGGPTTFRLYFVDCAEKELFRLNQDRVEDQRKYFRLGSRAEAVILGQAAQRFTLLELERRPFRIHTRGEEVYDSGRIYAHVEFPATATEPAVWLDEALVRRGLARIHTKGAPRGPGGPDEREIEAHLRTLEHHARQARRGGWGEVTSPNHFAF